MGNINDIVLTDLELIFLRCMRFRKSFTLKSNMSHLVSSALVVPNYSCKKNELGEYQKDGTYHISDLGIRFLVKRRRDFVHRIFTPITVTVLTDIALHVLRLLLQSIR